MENDAQQQPKSPGILSYGVAAIAGVLGAGGAAYSTIRDRFSKDIRESEAIAAAMGESHKQYVDGLEAITQDFIKGATREGKVVTAERWSELTSARKAQRSEKILKFLESKGFPFEGFGGHMKSMWLRYQMTSPNSKRATAINMAVVAAAGFAGTLTFFNNIEIRNHLRNMDSKQSGPEL